ncbi:MAG: oligosaccharide flippase family protein [Massilibacteroides sp.]|nr:oligosaccharide flippase family protein [Massilibacteroides sp.]MDD3062597.1 oligosaccharide flippase family protein [Massilibacteroides sp.]MDD4116191.1 oligosaccharide flippase family protein [Massilibacteroides sp.]MDD4660136.1 oligosaccharide flippase family protein [Massilibacteroides sp.]
MDIKERLRQPMVTNFFFLILLQGMNYLLPLLSFPYLVRVLGVERWGLVSFGYAFIQYFVMLTDFGFNLSGTKYISENRDNLTIVNRYLNAAMIGRLLLSLFSFGILIILVFSFERFKGDAVFFILYFGIVWGNVMFPMWFFQGMETMKYMTLFNIISKALSIIPFFLFVHRPEDYMRVPVFYSFGFLMAGFISLYLIYKKMGMSWFIPEFNYVKFALKDSSTYFLSRLSTSLFTTSNTFLIGIFLNNTAVGYYYAAEKLYQAYNQLLLPFTGVLFPHIAKSKDTVFFRKIFRKISYTNIFCLICAILLSSYIIQIVYGEGVQDSLSVFRILLLACFVTIPSMLLGYPFLAAMGHPKFTNLTLMIISFTHIFGLFILAIFDIFNIETVAGMVVFSELLLFLIRRYGVNRFGLFK